MTVEERLEMLEREQVETKAELARAKRRERRLLIVGAVVLASVGVLVAAWTRVPEASAQAPAEVAAEVRAQSFVLVDENGNTRAMLGMSEDGPALALWDEKDVMRATLRMVKEGASLDLFDANGAHRAGVAERKDGALLTVADGEDGNAVAGLVVTDDGPGMVLNDANGARRASFRILKDGPKVSMFDEDGNTTWQVP